MTRVHFLSEPKGAVMTSGVKDASIPRFEPVYDIWLYDGSVYPLGAEQVGLVYLKTWNGEDYPSSRPATIFQRYYDKIPFDGNPAMPDHPKISFREAWANRRLPRRKTTADHPYTMSLTMRSSDVFVYLQKDLSFPGDSWLSTRGFRGPGAGSDRYDTDFDSWWKTNDTISLSGLLRDKIAGSDFNMAIFLGEGRESLQLIGNTAVRIRKSLSALRRGDIRSVATILGISPPRGKSSFDPRAKGYSSIASEKWLEMQYGWFPLIKDVHAAAESLAKQLNEPFVQVYRVRKVKPLKCIPASEVAAGGSYTFTGYTRGQLIARVTEVNVAALNGLTDPASLGWELFPYSFVADWFIPIGSWLAARGLSSSVSGTFVTTVTRKEFFTCSALAINWPILKQPSVRFLKVELTRSVSNNIGVPTPNFKPLSKVASWQHCANAVALLTSRFGSNTGRYSPAL